MTDLYVFKLGGSSVSSIGALQHFAKRLERFADQRIFIVVSALSGVTDQLVRLSNKLAQGSSTDIEPLLDGLRTRHLTMASQLLPVDQAAAVAEDLVSLLQDLHDFCQTCPADSVGLRQRDRILTYGEALSSLLVRAYLESRGITIVRINACDILVTDDQYGSAEPLRGPSLARLKAIVRPLLAQGKAVITQGFCGATPQGQPTTLGRGGSDFSATYLGALLEAKEIEIRTDTPGVLSADPRNINNTRILREISHLRASTLAHFGAKVLHPRCIEPVIQSAIPVRVLSSFDPEDPGTLIGTADQPHSFSVTGRKAWLGSCKRPESLLPSRFRLATEALSTVSGYLAGSSDQAHAISAWDQPPNTEELPLELKACFSSSSCGWLYITSTELDQGLLNLIRQHLSELEINIDDAFVDHHGGGFALVIDPDQIGLACQHVHRLMIRAGAAATLA